MKAMLRTMAYCVQTPNRGLLLKPTTPWNDTDDELIVTGMSDADYAKDPTTRRSVSGYSTFLNGAPVTMKSGQQTTVTLSTAEAELMSATQCAQDMLYVMKLLESLGLKVRKPMVLKIDNKGAVDLANNWSIGGRTRHIEVRQHWLRDLKEEGIILTEWTSGADMASDLFTKNLDGRTFEKHIRTYTG